MKVEEHFSVYHIDKPIDEINLPNKGKILTCSVLLDRVEIGIYNPLVNSTSELFFLNFRGFLHPSRIEFFNVIRPRRRFNFRQFKFIDIPRTIEVFWKEEME